MVWWLVRDHVRRSNKGFVLGWVALAVLWFLTALDTAAWSLALAFTLAGALYVGPLTAFGQLAPREVLLLPIPRRELWLARWVAGTLVPAAWVATAQAVGAVFAFGLSKWAIGFSDWLTVGVAETALATTCVFLYSGAVMGLLPVLAHGPRPGGRRIWRWMSTVVSGIVLGLFTGAVVWPFLLRSYLPASWADFLGPSGLAAIAAATMTAVGYQHLPRQVAHPAPPAASRRTGPGRRRTSAILDDHFTGLPKLLWVQWRLTLGVIVAVFTILMLVLALPLALAFPEQSVLEGLREFGLLPRADGTLGALVFLAGFICLEAVDLGLVPPRADLLRAMVRHLKVLPILSIRITGVLLLRRAIGWMNVWLWLFVMHVVLVGIPNVPPLSWLIGFVGIDSLIQGWKLRWRKTNSEAFVLAVFVNFILLIIVDDAVIPHLAFAGAGLILLGAGAWLIHRSVTRHPSTYQPLAPQPMTGSVDVRL